MAIPVFRRFTISDYDKAPNWANQMFAPLNLFCEGTIQSLTKGLTIGQNVQGQKLTATFVTPSDYATGGFNSIVYNYTGGGTPTCLLIGSIVDVAGTALLTPISITSWVLNINTSPATVTVKYIAGLTASTKYNIVLLAL